MTRPATNSMITNRDAKVVLCGDPKVGKSSFLNRILNRGFSKAIQETIGVDFALKEVTVDNDNLVTLKIWDIAGIERISQFLSEYMKGADIAVVMADATNLKSIIAISTWIDHINKYANQDAKIFVVINKADQLIDTKDLANLKLALRSVLKDDPQNVYLYSSKDDCVYSEKGTLSLTAHTTESFTQLLVSTVTDHKLGNCEYVKREPQIDANANNAVSTSSTSQSSWVPTMFCAIPSLPSLISKRQKTDEFSLPGAFEMQSFTN